MDVNEGEKGEKVEDGREVGDNFRRSGLGALRCCAVEWIFLLLCHFGTHKPIFCGEPRQGCQVPGLRAGASCGVRQQWRGVLLASDFLGAGPPMPRQKTRLIRNRLSALNLQNLGLACRRRTSLCRDQREESCGRSQEQEHIHTRQRAEDTRR